MELSAAEFWDRVERSDKLPETAAPSPGAFEARYRHLMDRGATGIVCINLSSHLSGTMQSAQVAAAAVAGECPVQVIDSQSASMGQGNLCLTAARRAADGDSLESIVAEVVDRRDRTKLYATLDTLDHIRKSGRIGNARALLGSMLSIKPIIEIKEGVVEEVGEGAHPVEGAQGARGEGRRAEDRAPRGVARQRTRPRGAARPPRPDLPARRDHHRRRRPGDRHPCGAPRDRRELPGGALTTPGRVLGGRYHLVEPLARGGMASVWIADDPVLSRRVAVKILRDDLASDPATRTRFRNEAIAAARLNHPNVVATYDTGDDDGTAYIVMELIDGPTVRQLLQDAGRSRSAT